MICLITVFFVLSPMIIMYTAGLRFNFQTKKLESTGALNIDIEPKNADILINDIRITQSMPIRLTSLVPGTYRVSISQTGFHSLKKDFSVHSGETTYLKDTNLFKVTEPQKIARLDNPITKLWLNDSTIPLIYGYYNVSSTQFMFKISGSDYSETPLASEANFSCSASKRYCAIFTKAENTLTIIDTLNSANQRIVTVASSSNQLLWNHFYKSPLLFIGTNKKITQLNSNYSLTELAARNASIWFVADNQTAWIYSSGTIQNLNDPKQNFSFSHNQSLEEIIDIRNDFALLKTSKDIFLIKNPGQTNQTEKNIGAGKWEYHAPTKEWRLVSPWEITSIYNNGASTVLYRSDSTIQSAHSLDKNGLILIVANNKLIAFNPGYYLSQELAEFETIEAVDTDENERIIAVAGTWRGERGIYTLAY
ncbi:MAG: hypothetical protein A2821_00470 [Candidatus Magasanikbacteria bacterium RIFCSPHIGHO2_01_FULL_41_23]|nr:MAG: hypothetical protein A2821_00470 [Candidatus Magasanikbacteria bacterium RIFCSPHIGHO2_01_FULL_41_23]OGH74652.1 MAG: hypothetical protein A3F22_01825 [Candidatus Magasanikbacteria bacterium RIFCSPHIGHO2_12_FULL_41_16]